MSDAEEKNAEPRLDSSPESESQAAETSPSQPGPAEVPDDKPTGRDPVRMWTLILLVVIGVLLVWYLMADRFTPFTSQARLHALVVPIAPQVAGQVDRVLVSNNQRVTTAEVLFEINTDTFELQLQAAQADLQSARQAVGASEASVTAAEAGVNAAIATRIQAQQDAERMQDIKDEDPGAISERRVQHAEATLAAAIADVDASKANLEKARQDLGMEGERNVRILQAEIAIANAQLNIDRATVSAPDDGVVTDVRIDVGNFAAAGAPQMTFVATDNVWVQADFTENNLGHIQEGAPVEIIFDVLPGRVLSGKIRGTGFGVEVDSTPLGSLPTINNDKNWLREAQRFPVLVDFDAQHPGELGLRVGSQASVTVYTGLNPLLDTLGRIRMRIATYLSYAY